MALQFMVDPEQKKLMRLVADGKYEVHGPLAQPELMRPLEFEIPQQATADGVLELQWELMNVRRGPSVARSLADKTAAIIRAVFG